MQCFAFLEAFRRPGADAPPLRKLPANDTDMLQRVVDKTACLLKLPSSLEDAQEDADGRTLSKSRPSLTPTDVPDEELQHTPDDDLSESDSLLPDEVGTPTPTAVVSATEALDEFYSSCDADPAALQDAAGASAELQPQVEELKSEAAKVPVWCNKLAELEAKPELALQAQAEATEVPALQAQVADLEAQRTAELQDAASASAKLQEQVERLKSEASQVWPPPSVVSHMYELSKEPDMEQENPLRHAEAKRISKKQIAQAWEASERRCGFSWLLPAFPKPGRLPPGASYTACAVPRVYEELTE
ncbi:unnamed protein product, partial [Symbiodinium natans]